MCSQEKGANCRNCELDNIAGLFSKQILLSLNLVFTVFTHIEEFLYKAHH